jgi:hypothetical protein
MMPRNLLLTTLASITIVVFVWNAMVASRTPSLVLTVRPQLSVAGSNPILLMAKIEHDEVEAWYCPGRELWLDGDRVSRAEEDCPPFAEREEYPRRWIWYIARVEGHHDALVRLVKGEGKGEREIARGTTWWEVQ